MTCPQCASAMQKTQLEACLIRNGYGQQHVPGWRCSHCGRMAVPSYSKATCRCGDPPEEHSHEWLADRFRLWVLVANRGMHAVPIGPGGIGHAIPLS
jgi:hypothetical protein